MRLSAAEQANQEMVDRLIAEGALWSLPLIAAFRATPRHLFLDRVFQYLRRSERGREIVTREPDADELRILYADRALITRLGMPADRRQAVPISSSTQPSLMAQMLEDLKLGSGHSVLEVGAGTGYNAALLSHVVGPGLVTSVDVDADVLAEAWDHLRKVPDRQVALRHADGRQGLPEAAPYDRIIITAATPDLEPAWLEQLANKGLLLGPLVVAPGLSYIVRGTVTEGAFHGRLTRAAYFMPLRAAGVPASEFQTPQPNGVFQSVPAPWAGWFDRRRSRNTWPGFSQSLAFFGYLKGLATHYRMEPPPAPCYGASVGDSVCWFGPAEWQINDDGAKKLGLSLWQEFLDVGGPWPTEYRLRAGPRGSLRAGRRPAFIRQGPRGEQLWELPDLRDRPVWF